MKAYLLGGPRHQEWRDVEPPARPLLVVVDKMTSLSATTTTYQLFRELGDVLLYVHHSWGGTVTDELLDMLEDYASDPDLAGTSIPTPEPPRPTSVEEFMREVYGRDVAEMERQVRNFNDTMKRFGPYRPGGPVP